MFRTVVMTVAIGGTFSSAGRAGAASCYSDRVAYELMSPECEYLPPSVEKGGEGTPTREIEAEEAREAETETASTAPEQRKADEHG